MRVGAIVLGRLNSSRLPGKVLREVHGRPLIDYVLARLERTPDLDAIIVATSDEPGDDPLVAWCEARGVTIFRGALDDVAGRVLACAQHHRLDAIARVNADSPWLDPTLLGRAVVLIREGRHDLVTNLLERTWPYGISAEVLTVAALRRARDLSSDPEESEHVTLPFYAQPGQFSILNILSSPDLRAGAIYESRFTIDTEQDLMRFARLVEALGDQVSIAGTDQIAAAAQSLERSAKNTQ